MKLSAQPRRGRLLGTLGPIALNALLLLSCAAGEKPSGASEAPKPPAQLRASVDRATATTGDLITYEVVIERDPEVDVEFADPGVDIAGFRIVDLGRDPSETLSSGRILERRWYRLRADLVGLYTLPALSASYSEPSGGGGDLETPEISVEVESVLPEDGSEVTDIRDIKPLRRIETGRQWLWWLVGVAAALALAAAWWWRRRRRQDGSGAPEAPRIPPYDLAIQELERLRRTDFSNLRELRRYYFAVSSVVRAYIEGRFGMNATDLTTEEILGRLDEPGWRAPAPTANQSVRPSSGAGREPGWRGPAPTANQSVRPSSGAGREPGWRAPAPTANQSVRPSSGAQMELGRLDPVQARRLERFLIATDQVKFAAHLPGPEEIDRTYEQALEFVRATRPREDAAGEDGGEEPALQQDRTGKAA